MQISALALPRSLFRDREAALANGVVLAWVSIGWLGSFGLMAAASPLLNAAGVLLCANTMILAAYLIHEAAHQTLFTTRTANSRVGEAMSFVAGSSYASFERLRHMHIRHHLERADLSCFDHKGLLERHPALCRTLEICEWAYVPATETLMHLQVIWRPVFERAQRPHLPRALTMLVVRLALLTALGVWSLKALLLYGLAWLLQVHVLNFFDAFHHSFEQYFVAPRAPIPMQERRREFELANTYSNLISTRWPWLNLLTLNFGYHNAHHAKASVPWYRLPALHRRLFGDTSTAVMPLAALLGTYHRNRVRRVSSADYGEPGPIGDRADAFVGAHGVSFLTVI